MLAIPAPDPSWGERMAALPWSSIAVAAVAIGLCAYGLYWMDKNNMGAKEAQDLLAKAFVEGAQAVDPSRRKGFYGGWTDAYFWDQKPEELEMLFWVPKGTRGRDVKVDVTTSTIDIRLKGELKLSGDLEREVKATETVWFIEAEPDRLVQPPANHVAINVTLQKKVSTDPMTHWPELIAGGGSTKR